MGFCIRLLAAVTFGLALIGCSSTGGPSASEAEDLLTTSTSEGGALDASTVAGSTDDDATGGDSSLDESAESTSTTAATSTTATTATTSVQEQASTTTATTAAPTTTEGPPSQVFLPGDSGSFSSPSGNISCVMSVASGVSCHIGEKSWTIEQPTGPFCDESDWGNAVDVTTAGVDFPCYTDFYWNPDASPLAYGDRMEVGEFSCISRESGVTCDNGSAGFEVARRHVKMLDF